MRAFLSESIHTLGDLIEEIGHEMDVLEHDPLTIFVSHIEEIVSNNILSLSQRNLVKTFCGVFAEGYEKILYVSNGVSTRGKNEVDRNLRSRFGIR